MELTRSCSPGSAAARRHWQSLRVYRVELQKYCVVLYLQQKQHVQAARAQSHAFLR